MFITCWRNLLKFIPFLPKKVKQKSYFIVDAYLVITFKVTRLKEYMDKDLLGTVNHFLAIASKKYWKLWSLILSFHLTITFTYKFKGRMIISFQFNEKISENLFQKYFIKIMKYILLINQNCTTEDSFLNTHIVRSLRKMLAKLIILKTKEKEEQVSNLLFFSL